MKRKPKDTMIMVKASKSDHAAFTKLALERHTTLSQLIRELLHRELSQKETVAA